MKNKVSALIFSLCLTGTFTSCNFLDIDPVGTYNEKSVFSDPALAEVYVNAQYTKGRTGWGTSALRFSTDESMCNFNWNTVYSVNIGAMTPDNLGGIDTWTQYYSNIKECNQFFENVPNMKGDPKWIDRLVGEMTFLRAFYYMDLVSRYGGVPIITKTFGLTDNMMIKRNTYQECVDFLVKEFDKASTLLPVQQDDKSYGRATKGAALAYKARLLLYVASPLWNTTNDNAKWQAASDAALAVMNLTNGGKAAYALDSDYKGMFLNQNSPEIIYERLYNSEFGHYFNGNNMPNGWGGYSATCVLQDMVNAYERVDGTMATDADYIGTANPYLNRDPRFYASVVYDGAQFAGGEAEFFINSDNKSGGGDSEYGSEGWNHTKSRYSIRKFIKEDIGTWDKCPQPWIYCRLGEVYLNYAEAQFHLGNEAVARQYVNLIRKRARGGKTGILPDVTETGTALLAKIQHERQIELAFEEHRFFDVRRWKIAEVTDNKPARGIQVVKDINTGVKTYSIVTIQQRAFKPQHYLLPIPQSERLKNSDLEQNPGYTK